MKLFFSTGKGIKVRRDFTKKIATSTTPDVSTTKCAAIAGTPSVFRLRGRKGGINNTLTTPMVNMPICNDKSFMIANSPGDSSGRCCKMAITKKMKAPNKRMRTRVSAAGASTSVGMFSVVGGGWAERGRWCM